MLQENLILVNIVAAYVSVHHFVYVEIHILRPIFVVSLKPIDNSYFQLTSFFSD